MADDIDIEEHDVLESLRRRQGPASESPSLPDTSLVKTEPVDHEYNDSQYEDPNNYEYEWEWEKGQPQIKIEPHTEEDFPFGKIILGSKPATPPPQETPDLQENYNYNMSLVLEDWAQMLNNSDCYCEKCKILFATVNALDAHKMVAHSFLVATNKEPSPDRNKAVKSTAKSSADRQTCQICQHYFKGVNGRCNLLRHYREVHKVDPATIASKKDFKSWRVCNHCNKYFPDDTSLVKHLYELLPLNDKTPNKNDKKTSKPAEKVKPVLNVAKSDPKPSVSNNVKTAIVAEGKAAKNVSSTLNKNANRIILGSKAETKTVGNNGKTKNWRCDICGINYSRTYYVKHMRRYHHNVAVKKINKKDMSTNIKSPNKILLNNCSLRFKCIVCNEILTSYYMCRKHKKKHPQMKGQKMLVKLVKTGKTQKDNVVKTEPVKGTSKKEISEEASDIVVSKSTIFKCNRCSVHFLTCTGACQHSIVCETSSNIRDWACPKCQRVFKSVEKTAHEYQHKIMNSTKFRVYVVYLEMIVRVLCECPDCYVCFEEDMFLRHATGGCKNDAESYYCNECRLPIDVRSQANHDRKHTQGDFTKDDFIKIDYVSSKKILAPLKIKTGIVEQQTSPAKQMEMQAEVPRKALKRKLEMEEVPVKKTKVSNPDELHLYFCSFCKTYLVSKQSKFHMNGLCKESPLKYRAICKCCGLCLSSKFSKTHMELHEKFPNVTLSDFTFTRMSDSKKIKPQPVTYPCKGCNVNFQSKWAKHCHKCGETSSVNCQVCHKQIQKAVYKIHMQFHKYVIPSQIKIFNSRNAQNSPSPSVSRSDVKSPVKKLPDLLMKYQSLTALWNILYLCATCDTFTDSYDKVVEHCQNHLTNMENYGVVIMKCQICDMKFDSECYRRHLELHAGSKVIAKKTFQILKYEYYNLFASDWFDFINVPEEQKLQIVSRSIYGENRCVKMKLLQQGPPEYTLYKCSKCLNCVAPDSIVYHVKLFNCLKAHKLPCSICDMTFTIRSQCKDHVRIHKATGLGVESFRIVAFNDASDLDSNIKIMSYDTDNQGSRNKTSLTDERVPPKEKIDKNVSKSKSFVFYKCAQCHVCHMHIKNFRKHTCSTSTKRVCSKCGLLFPAVYLKFHNKLHDRYKISRNNVVVKTVNKEGQVINIKKQIHERPIVSSPPKKSNDNAEERSKLYKCYCGLHYTSLKTIEKHYKMKNCSTIVRDKCSQCHLVFDPIEIVNHLCKHHAQTQTKTFDIVTPNKKTLFKCSQCHILFYTKNSALQHKGECVGKFSGKKCDKCGLAFDATSLPTHMVDHERNNKLRADCYVIVKIPDENVISTKNIRKNSHLLYRCQKCDVHFLKRETLQIHSKKHVKGINTKLIENCSMCGLRFTKKTMHWHILWQHKQRSIKEFLVRSFDSDGNIIIPKAEPERVPKMTTPKGNKQMGGETSSPKVIPVIKSEPKLVEREVKLYKCQKCAIHFTDEGGLVHHNEDRCSKELTEDCEDCDIKFASKDMKEHKNHHKNGVTLILNIKEGADALNVERIVRKKKVYKPVPFPLDGYDNKLYKCTVCNFHYNSKNTLLKHSPQMCNLKPTIMVKCEICDIGFTRHSLHRHTMIHERFAFQKDDFVILTLADLDDLKIETNHDESQPDIDEDTVASLDTSTDLETVESSGPANVEVKVEKKDKIHFFYKCADCNLYFVTPRACHKHIIDHTPLDSKEYIECKLCGFQFTIMTLQTHIKKHHAEQFNLEEVLVEEYQPNNIKTSEKYYASEKDQSSLVSTSDDVKNVSNTQVENDNEVTSCNEIVDTVESSDQNGAQHNIDIDDNVCGQGSNTVLDEITEPESSDGNVVAIHEGTA